MAEWLLIAVSGASGCRMLATSATVIEATSREWSGAKWMRSARSRIASDLAFLYGRGFGEIGVDRLAEDKRARGLSSPLTAFGAHAGVFPFGDGRDGRLGLLTGSGEADDGI